jgi:putative hydrolase of the HAD superfamily
MDNLILLEARQTIIHDPLHELVTELALTSERTKQELNQWYLNNQYSFLSGSIDSDEFLEELIEYAKPDEDLSYFNDFVFESLRLLPAALEIKEMAANNKVALLTNAHADWIEPILKENDFEDVFQAIFISSKTGNVKPEPEAIQFALNELGEETAVLVDFDKDSLTAAKKMGLKTVYSDPDGDWLDSII